MSQKVASTDEVKVLKCCYQFLWAIGNFSSLRHEVGQGSMSFQFSIGNVEKVRWCLTLWPNGRNKQARNYLSMSLSLVSNNKNEVLARYRLSLVNNQDEETFIKESDDIVKFHPNESIYFDQFISRSILLDAGNNLLFNDKLSICCEVYVVFDNRFDRTTTLPKNGSIVSTVPSKILGHGRGPQPSGEPGEESQLVKDLEELLGEQKFGDLIFRAEGKELLVHKAILVARSPAFKEMLLPALEDNQKKERIELPVSYNTLVELLHYLYTDKTEHIEEVAGELFAAADKYRLGQLKTRCSTTLRASITVENVAALLVLADEHYDLELKTKAIQFVNSYPMEVADTPGFKALVKSHPHLIAEAFRALALMSSQMGTGTTSSVASLQKRSPTKKRFPV